MRISKGAIAVLGAVGLGAFLVFRAKKANAGEAEQLPPGEPDDTAGEVDETEGVIRLPEAGGPVIDVPPPVFAPPPPASSRPRAPAPPPVFVPPPFVGPPPPPEEEEEEEIEEDEEEELEPIAPPFFPQPSPPPVSSRPIPIPLPPPIMDPGLPDLVTLPPVQGIPIGIPAPPPRTAPPPPRIPVLLPPQEPPQPDVPDDTADLVASMLEKEGGRWKVEEPALRDWLEDRGQPGSTKFGPGSAALMAEEIGTLPIVRFWPSASGTNPGRALEEYRNKLRAIARTKPEPHRSQLLASADREEGQSFGPPQGDSGRAPIADRVTLDIFGEDA